jgi:hypothetical protein
MDHLVSRPAGGPGATLKVASNTRKRKSSKAPTKVNRVLQALAEGRSFNRFEATRELRDWCLHSTVSQIQNRIGIPVARQEEVVPGYKGCPTWVMRYWLTDAARQLALDYLANYTKPDKQEGAE